MQAEKQPLPLLVGSDELAKLIGLTPRTIYTLRQQGLPHIQVTPKGKTLFDPADVVQWLKSRYGQQLQQQG